MPPRKRKAPEELSTRQEQMRVRIRRAGKAADKKADRVGAEIQNYYKQIGRPIEEWDWEELARGRPRAINGTFVGRTPSWVTPTVVNEAKRRLMAGIYGEMGTQSKFALDVLRRLLTSGDVDDKVALDAAKYVIDHIIGKPEAIIKLDGSETVRQFLANALVLDDGAPEHEVIDGEYVTDSEEDDDE